MRDRAARKPHPRVELVAGCAERIPLRDDAVDAAWLSNVIHHFDDLDGAAAELRRAVTADGPILIRGALGGREYDLSLYRFFPEASGVVESMPSLPDVVAIFEAAGFTSFQVERVQQLTARSYADAYEAAKMRADTALELISDDAFAEGLERLAEAARVDEGPVLDTLDLLVLR